MNTRNRKFLLLFFCVLISISGIAQNTFLNSTVTAEQIIEKLVKQYITHNHYDNSTTIIQQIDTLLIESIVRKEIEPLIKIISEFINVNEQSAKKDEELQIYRNVLALLNKRQEEIQTKKWSYIPFGAHQFANKQVGKGIFFAGTQAGLLVSGSILADKARKTYNTLETEQYQSDSRRKSLEKSYGWQLAGTITCFAGAAASIIWNYCDNFKTERNKNFSFAPTVMLDWEGKPQMGMNLSIKF